MSEVPEEESVTEGSNALVKHLIELEQRIVHLEQSIHPDQITKVVAQKIAMHLHGLTFGEHAPPPVVHDHKA